MFSKSAAAPTLSLGINRERKQADEGQDFFHKGFKNLFKVSKEFNNIAPTGLTETPVGAK